MPLNGCILNSNNNCSKKGTIKTTTTTKSQGMNEKKKFKNSYILSSATEHRIQFGTIDFNSVNAAYMHAKIAFCPLYVNNCSITNENVFNRNVYDIQTCNAYNLENCLSEPNSTIHFFFTAQLNKSASQRKNIVLRDIFCQ